MALKDGGARFGAISIVNHWVVATLIIVMLAIGLYMSELPRGPERFEWVQVHKSIGVIVLFLGAWRVLWRAWSRFPQEIAVMPRWQEIAANAIHAALLVAVIAMPVSGYITSSTGGHDISFFGLFNMPALPENKALSEAAAGVHGIVAYVLIAVLAVHVLAALKHHVVDKDATLRRMIGRAA